MIANIHCSRRIGCEREKLKLEMQFNVCGTWKSSSLYSPLPRKAFRAPFPASIRALFDSSTSTTRS